MESRKRINIMNVAAGQGTVSAVTPADGENYYTACVGDATQYVIRRCREGDEPLLFCVYGGDGTLNEVVSGIVQAGAGERAFVCVVPKGTGNDFVRTVSPGDDEVIPVDVMQYTGGYSVNVLNMGFDCDVVTSASRMKTLPLIAGSAAYVMGVANVLLKKMGKRIRVTMEDIHGNIRTLEKEVLLCAVANANFYGGGFCAAPAAQYDDGLMDLMLIRKMSRLKFISLVKYYKNGQHVEQDGTVAERFRELVEYYRCRKIRIEGMTTLCADGEVAECGDIELSVLPRAVRFVKAPIA